MWLTVTTLLLLAATTNTWSTRYSHQSPAGICTNTITISSLVHGTNKHAHRITSRSDKPVFLYIAMVLLANSNDIESNPGPQTELHGSSDSSSTLYLCGSCKEPVTWNDMGVMCEDCESWFHIDCQGIGDNTYERLGDKSVVWTCLTCDGPNYSSLLFDLHGINTSNKFDALGATGELSSTSIDTFNSSDEQTLAQPLHSSSPVKPRPKPAVTGRPLRIINVNCQSLVNKKPLFYNLVESTKPDIIAATETWFTGQIHDAEYFNLDHYTVYRRDRCNDTSGGGIIIAVNEEYNSLLEEDLGKNNVEMIWVKVSMKGCKHLYVGGCYRAKADDAVTVDALDDCLQAICGRHNSPVLLAGDFNFPGCDWANNTAKGELHVPEPTYQVH